MTFRKDTRIASFAAASFFLLPWFAQAQVVRIDSGPVSGVTADGVTSYKGIPYAAPPVGPLRWKAPQPAAKWTSVRSGASYGHDCMQLPFPSDAAPLGTPPAEDCLVVNVWTPAKSAGKKRPVMFWIYGGGWVNGGSSPAVYDGSEFAKGDVVLVSVNYRLGRFGFFAHPALTKEANGAPEGNYGYLDQIAGLKWVQRNIAAFGGDPGNVTIFGESAGGFSVHTLITTRLSDGLFKRAIVESGGGRSGLNSPRLHEATATRPSAESIGVAFAKKNGIAEDDPAALEKLRALPAETLVDGLNMASMAAAMDTYPGPIIDGVILEDEIGALYAAGKQHKVPVMVGANGMDIGFNQAKTKDELFAGFGDKAADARAAYDPTGSEPLKLLAMRVAGDQFMVEPARFIARKVTEGGQPAYEYRFSYVATSMRAEWPSAPHASEIPYVFDTVKARYGSALTADDEKTARATISYWLNFARSGDPNGGALTKWPAYDPAGDRLLEFSNTGTQAEADPWKARLDLSELSAK